MADLTDDDMSNSAPSAGWAQGRCEAVVTLLRTAAPTRCLHDPGHAGDHSGAVILLMDDGTRLDGDVSWSWDAHSERAPTDAQASTAPRDLRPDSPQGDGR